MERSGYPSGGPLFSALFVVLFSCASLEAVTAWRLLDARPNDRFRLMEQGERSRRVVAHPAGMTARKLTSRELRLAEFTCRSRLREGGGAAVSLLTVTQVGYVNESCAGVGECDVGPCNELLIRWVEDPVEAAGVDLIIDDGDALTLLPGPGQLPGGTGILLSGVAAGQHGIRIEGIDSATFDEVMMTVVDDLPFSDPVALECIPEPVEPPEICEFGVRIENPDRQPTTYGVFLDDIFIEAIDGSSEEVTRPGVTPGEHCLDVIGLLETESGSYRGCPAQICCTLVCGPCDPPSGLVVCQTGYGEKENLFQAFWRNGEPSYAGGVEAFLDGESVMLGDGASTFLFFSASSAEHVFGVEGICVDPDERSTRTETSFSGVDTTPHPNPIDGEVTCEWSPDDGGTLTALWTNADPSTFIDIYVQSGESLFLVGSAAGTTQGATITGALATDTLILQFFIVDGSGCFGSGLVTCQPGGRGSYIPGLCAGNGSLLSITDAILILGFLFLGSDSPPCFAACDCNGDGQSEISDALCVLGFLFLGQQPPVGWVGAAATCVAVQEGEDCDTPSAACDG